MTKQSLAINGPAPGLTQQHCARAATCSVITEHLQLAVPAMLLEIPDVIITRTHMPRCCCCCPHQSGRCSCHHPVPGASQHASPMQLLLPLTLLVCSCPPQASTGPGDCKAFSCSSMRKQAQHYQWLALRSRYDDCLGRTYCVPGKDNEQASSNCAQDSTLTGR